MWEGTFQHRWDQGGGHSEKQVIAAKHQRQEGIGSILFKLLSAQWCWALWRVSDYAMCLIFLLDFWLTMFRSKQYGAASQIPDVSSTCRRQSFFGYTLGLGQRGRGEGRREGERDVLKLYKALTLVPHSRSCFLNNFILKEPYIPWFYAMIYECISPFSLCTVNTK